MKYETMIYEVKENVCWITLNRPERKNAINLQWTIDLRRALLCAEDDEKVRAVVITGAGDTFCAGADLALDDAKNMNMPVHLLFKETNLYFHSAISIITNMRKPVIAALNGSCAGAGMSLALSCDIIVAKEGSKFNWAFCQRGLTPDGASTQNLTRRIGLHRAMEIAFTGKILSSQEALAWGIVNYIYPTDVFQQEVKALAEKIAKGPTWAYGVTKYLIRQSFFNSPEKQMELENNFISEASTKDDFTEGVMSFLQKREAKFKGK